MIPDRNGLAPKLYELFGTAKSMENAPEDLLDLCCGTGQLAKYLLERDYNVIGTDLSRRMLEFAVSNTRSAIASVKALERPRSWRRPL